MAGGQTTNYQIAFTGDEQRPGPEHVQALAESLDAQIAPILVFSDNAERLAALPFPQIGQQTWLRDVHRLDVYRNGQWEPVHPVVDVAASYTSTPTTAVDVPGPFRLVAGTKVVTTDANGNSSFVYSASPAGTQVVACVCSLVVTATTNTTLWVQPMACTTTTITTKTRQTNSALDTAVFANYSGTGLRINYMVLLKV